MLIQKPVSMGDIVSIKLSNGDEIVGKFINQDTLSCTISKPVIVAIQPVGPSQVTLGFMPFMVSSDEDTNVVLPLSAMLTKPIKARDDVANNYRRATSELEIATPGSASKSGLVF